MIIISHLPAKVKTNRAGILERRVGMRTTRYSEIEIIYAVKRVEMGISIREIARKYGVCENTVHQWRRKYEVLSPRELRRLKDLERENSQRKKLVADLSLDKEILQDVLRRDSEVFRQIGSALRDSRGFRCFGAQSVQIARTASIGVPLRVPPEG